MKLINYSVRDQKLTRRPEKRKTETRDQIS